MHLIHVEAVLLRDCMELHHLSNGPPIESEAKMKRGKRGKPLTMSHKKNESTIRFTQKRSSAIETSVRKATSKGVTNMT